MHSQFLFDKTNLSILPSSVLYSARYMALLEWNTLYTQQGIPVDINDIKAQSTDNSSTTPCVFSVLTYCELPTAKRSCVYYIRSDSPQYPVLNCSSWTECTLLPLFAIVTIANTFLYYNLDSNNLNKFSCFLWSNPVVKMKKVGTIYEIAMFI